MTSDGVTPVGVTPSSVTHDGVCVTPEGVCVSPQGSDGTGGAVRLHGEEEGGGTDGDEEGTRAPQQGQ